MVARLLAYSVAEVLQAEEKIEGENSEELFTKSIKVIDRNPVFRMPLVVLMVGGAPEFKWIKKSIWIPWLENKKKKESK